MDMSGIDRQNHEFDALEDLSGQWKALQRIAVVDDDYPHQRTHYEAAMARFIRAIKDNGRLNGNAPAANPMTFGEFSHANRSRCEALQGFNHRLDGWSTSDWMTALVGEVGEAANVVKKLNRVRDGVPGNKQSADELRLQLRKELGDVFVYLDLMAQSLGFSIADAAIEVFNAKSAEIGYPGKMKNGT